MSFYIANEVKCRIIARFRTCSNRAVEACQYCGRPFCADHTHHIGDHNAVCTRPKCAKKWDDVGGHELYLARAAELNRYGHCAVEECGPSHERFQCSRCKQLYCEEHLKERKYGGSLLGGGGTHLSVCEHCHARRKLWR